jgi:Lysophospholipase
MQRHSQWVDTSDHQRLYVKTWGEPEQPALVLVHGYPDHQDVWEAVISHLVQDYFVVTYDVRGAGDSSVPKKIRDYRLERLCADLEQVVDQVLPDELSTLRLMTGGQSRLGKRSPNLNLKAGFCLLAPCQVHVWIMLLSGCVNSLNSIRSSSLNR